MYDYISREANQKSKNDRSQSEVKNHKKVHRTNKIEQINAGFDSKESFDFGPPSITAND